MKPVNRGDYIFAQKQNRERIATNRFFTDLLGMLRDQFNRPFGWTLPSMWLGLRIPHERLLKGFNRPPKKLRGDVDVFGAPLGPVSGEAFQQCVEAVREEDKRVRVTLPEELRHHEMPLAALQNVAWTMLIERGLLKWPPDLSRINAIEVKVSYYSAEDELKATGSGSRNQRRQALELCEMGFDRVALARFLVTEPVLSDKHHPWLLAGARSGNAMDEYLSGSGVSFHAEENDPFGTVLISVGSVPGKLEDMAGSLSHKWLRQAPENPYRERALEVRKVIEENLLEVMSPYPVPRNLPVLLLVCSDYKCGRLYLSERDPDHLCPQCGKTPR